MKFGLRLVRLVSRALEIMLDYNRLFELELQIRIDEQATQKSSPKSPNND